MLAVTMYNVHMYLYIIVLKHVHTCTCKYQYLQNSTDFRGKGMLIPATMYIQCMYLYILVYYNTEPGILYEAMDAIFQSQVILGNAHKKNKLIQLTLSVIQCTCM